MKHLVIIISILCLAMLPSCNGSAPQQPQLTAVDFLAMELAEAASTVTQACPFNNGTYETMLRAEYTNKVFTYHFALNEDSVINLDNENFTNNFRQQMRQTALMRLIESPAAEAMLNALVATKSEMKYKYIGTRTHKELQILLTRPELLIVQDQITAIKEKKAAEE